MDWRYVGVKVGIRFAIWSLIVAVAIAFLVRGPRVESGTMTVVVLIASLAGNVLAAVLTEAALARLGIASRSRPAPNAEGPKG